jgi:hypothetical protein
MRTLGHLGEIDPKEWREVPDWLLGPFWIDKFCDLNTKDYGSNEFHGRFHPAIPWLAMKRFTKPGDTVWDPFSGSGTTLDVGNELGRKVIATDLHTTRDDILKKDVRFWIPDTMIDLGIMHPPYWNIIDYDDSMSQAESLSGFVNEFERCFLNMHKVLKPGHILVLVIGEIFKDGTLYPLEYDLDMLIGCYEYRRVGRIVKDFGETKGGKSGGGQSANLWKYRLLKWGYFRIGIDTILFYQKPL